MMQISSRFTIAVHIFACIAAFQEDHKITSDFLASSVNVNPVIIRNLLSKLKTAGLLEVKRGSGGASFAKQPEDISFRDIYEAVECVDHGALFHFHENPSKACPVGRNIHHILDDRLTGIQQAMEDALQKITLADLIKDTAHYIAKEKNA